MLDLPADAPIEDCRTRLTELHKAYRADYQAYYDRHADAASPAIRGADPAIVLIPGVGMFSYGKHSSVMAAANLVSIQSPSTALGYLSGPSEVAYFALPFRLRT